jgi:ApaG protein
VNEKDVNDGGRMMEAIMSFESSDYPLHAPSSEAVTNHVRVEVQSMFAPERSIPFEGVWSFYYTVRITNEGRSTVKLISRHWVITDATGHVDEVRGPGVVGVQPVLAPGESFEYTSGCRLNTPSGVMRGTYHMTVEDDQPFDVAIAPFALSEPYTVH